MRRWLLCMVCLVVLSMSVSLTLAIGAENPDLTKLLQYVPDDSSLLVAIRSDDAYIDSLNDIFARVASKLPDSLKSQLPNSLDLNDLLSDSLNTNDYTWDDLRAILGDTIVVSTNEPFDILNANTTAFELVHIVLAHSNRAELERLLNLDDLRTTTQDEFEIGEAAEFSFAISDDVLILSNTNTLIPRNALLEESDFQDMLVRLPNPDYNILMYTPPVGTTAFLIGLDIEDDVTLIIDAISEAAPGLPTEPVTQQGENIPADTDLLFEIMDFSGTFETTLDTLDQMGTTSPSTKSQLQQALLIFGVNLDRDILSWTDGYFAMFASVNTNVLANLILEPNGDGIRSLETFPAEFGIVFEATDPRSAQQLAQKLGISMGIFASSTVQLRKAEVGTLVGTQITIELPITARRSIDLELFFGANQDIFFIGTKSTAQKIVEGDTLANDPVYQNASRHFLEGASQIAYTDDEGVGSIGLLVAALVSPMMTGNSLQTPDTRQTIQGDFLTDDSVLEIVRALEDIVESMSITSLPSGKYIVNRAVMTLK